MNPLEYPRRRLPEAVVRRLFDLWLGGSSALQAAEITGVNRNTALWHFRRFRGAAAHLCGATINDAEVDECYVGCNQRKAESDHKRGRSLEGKVVLLGAVDRDSGQAVAEIAPDAKGITLRGFIARAVQWGSRVITDGFKAYKGISLMGYIHSQVNHAKGIWKRGDGHTNRVENLWRQLRRYMTRYNGAMNRWRHRASLFLREALFFFNVRGAQARMKALGVTH